MRTSNPESLVSEPMTPEGLHPAYFETRFRVWDGSGWPGSFGIVSAWTTTGESWPAAEARAADEALTREVLAHYPFARRLIGYSPTTGHAEPSWAIGTDLRRTKELGRRYRQDAVYWVENGRLSVTRVAREARLVVVGGFHDRLDDPIAGDEVWRVDERGPDDGRTQGDGGEE
ncbi:MAG: DUF3293 domain-containing protein [Longimicrobiales bacterium]